MKWGNLFYAGLFLILSNWCANPSFAQTLDKNPFESGEKLTYKISYGWIPIGRAKVDHDFPVEADTFNVEVLAYTTGIVSWIAPLHDYFNTTIHKATLLPEKAFADRNEGKDLRKEYDDFDYLQDSVHMLVFEDGQVVEEKMVAINDSVYDMVSTYTYLRTRVFSHMAPEDSLMLKVYYEGKQYNFGLEYIGKTEISSILGEVPVHALYVLFPISGTFPRKHMVKVWVTADEYQLPVLIEAQMKFGKARVELVDYQGKYVKDRDHSE